MIIAWLTTSRRDRYKRIQRQTILVGEELEQRCAPARFKWNVTDPNTFGAAWNDAEFWLKETTVQGQSLGWYTTSDIPRGDSDVIFASESGTAKCFINNPNTVVKSLTIEKGYLGTLNIAQQTAFTVTDTLTMSGGTIQVGERGPGFPNPGNAKLWLPDGGTFNWQGGTFDGINVVVQSGSRMNVTAYAEAGEQRHTTSSTVLDIGGVLRWYGTDVYNAKSARAGSPPASMINIRPGGVFDIIDSAGRTWGRPLAANAALDPSLLWIVNNIDGTVVSNAPGTATFIANYTTYGTTNLVSGTLYIHGSAVTLQPSELVFHFAADFRELRA